MKNSCNVVSSVSSGWKPVASIEPCSMAIGSSSRVARIWRGGTIDPPQIAESLGARINTAVIFLWVRFFAVSVLADGRSISIFSEKLSICVPYALRSAEMSMTASDARASLWFWRFPFTSFASKIAPAQVPQTGRGFLKGGAPFMAFFNGSKRPYLLSSFSWVVLSPPGRTIPLIFRCPPESSRSSGRRTSVTSKFFIFKFFAAFISAFLCSITEPWIANTPIFIRNILCAYAQTLL